MSQDHSSIQQEQQNQEEEAQLEVEANKLNIDDLPSEMIRKIFQCVDTWSLFACRLVSKKWLEVSSEILHFRPESTIWFWFEEGEFSQIALRTREKSLKNFIQTFQENSKKVCPYARFHFSNRSVKAPAKLFDHEDWIAFVSVFGFGTPTSRIKHLKLGFGDRYIDHPKSAMIVTEKVGDLLLNKIPHLEEFGLILHPPCLGTSFKIQLFSNQTENEEPGEAHPQKKMKMSNQLPHLKVLHLDSNTRMYYPRVFEDILGAANNLKKIIQFESLIIKDDPDFFITNFEFLFSMGKLDLISKAEIRLSTLNHGSIKPNDILIQMSQNPPPVLNLNELKLDLSVPGIFPDPNSNEVRTFKTDATNFISLLLESSKNSLKKLTIFRLGFVSGLQFPRFSNLAELNLIQKTTLGWFGNNNNQNLRRQLFPRGVRSKDIFPAVRILNFTTNEDKVDHTLGDWTDAFPHEDSVPCLPLVENLKVIGSGIMGNAVSILALMCPNLKNAKIAEKLKWSPALFLDVGRAIWTHMKQLESLELDFDLTGEEGDSIIAFDSCFTGISEEDVERLYELKEADRILKKWGTKTQVSESEMTAERKYASILDIKKLKTLTLKRSTVSSELNKEQDFFKKNLSWISEEYAFKFMPHLKPKTNQND